MAEFVTKIRTVNGDLQIDYKSLANLPKPDATLSKSGEFADAKATGDTITELSNELNANIEKVQENMDGLTAEDVGALPVDHVHVTSIGGKSGDVILEAGDGIDVDGTTITNTGVRSILTGGENGTISVNTNGTVVDIAVQGLGSAAYTESTEYATAGHIHHSKYSAILSSSGWSGSGPYTQTVTVSGLLDTDSPFIDLNMSSATVDTAEDLQEAWAYVGRIVANKDSLTAYCYNEKPETNIPITIMVIR